MSAPDDQCDARGVSRRVRGRVTIWGGIPSVLLCRESVTEQHFRNSIDDLVARHGKRTRFVLGVSDMVTADCDWDRMRYVTEKVTAIA